MSKPLLNLMRNTKRLKESTFVAPVGGLNLIASYDNMPPQDAIEMDNYLPKNNAVELRRGYKEHAKLGVHPRTLAVYQSATGKDRLFAFGDGRVFEVSKKDNYQSISVEYLFKMQELGDVYASDDWQWVQFKEHLFLSNGTDKVQIYAPDETDATFGSLSDANFEGDGFVSEKIMHIFVAKQRLWFVEKNALRVWYTEQAGAIQGKVIPFDVGQLSDFSGTLVAGTSWSIDGGAGVDDLTCLITSEGETLVYKGSNPSSSDDWALVGVYKMPKPVGKNPFLKYQGDVILTSFQGYVPLKQALLMEKSNVSALEFGAKIAPLVTKRASFYKSKTGWQAIEYPKGGYILFNVPLSNGFEQHIYNTSTGAWSRFTGINGESFVLFQDNLYFANKEGVFLFDTGFQDGNNPICGSIRQAYTCFNNLNEKRVLMLKPNLKATSPFALQIYTDADFMLSDLPYQTDIQTPGESYWNNAKWGSLNRGVLGTKWARLVGVQTANWINNMAQGVYFSLVLKTKTKSVGVTFYGTGVRYE